MKGRGRTKRDRRQQIKGLKLSMSQHCKAGTKIGNRIQGSTNHRELGSRYILARAQSVRVAYNRVKRELKEEG